MPIRRLLQHNDAFSPQDVQVLLGAFDDTLRALNLTDRERPLTMMVAKLIIEFAKEGERDPDRLRDLVLKALRRVNKQCLRFATAPALNPAEPVAWN